MNQRKSRGGRTYYKPAYVTLSLKPSEDMYGKSLLALIRLGRKVIGSKCYYSIKGKNSFPNCNIYLNEKPTQEKKPSQTKTQTVTHANHEKALKPESLGQAGPGVLSFPKAGKCFAGVRPRRQVPQRVGSQGPHPGNTL